MGDRSRPSSPVSYARPIDREEMEPRSRSRSASPSRKERRSRSITPPVKSEARSMSRSRSPRSRHYSPDRRSRRRSRSRSVRRSRRSVSPRRRSRSPRSRRRSPRRNNHNDKEFHGTRDEPEVSNILGVFGLSLRTREEDLKEVFSEYGTIEKVTIVYDHRSDRSRGFGFVYFKDQTEASRAREALNGMDIDERKIRVDYSMTHRPHTPTPGQYMGERRPDFHDRGRSSYRDSRRSRRSRSRSYDRRRKYYRSKSRSRSWSR
ncbi:hypothetical protein BY458DRAFT_543617 [Sporodiniella umbellata]|nr:hypothetical protein BY458DRAFT_543617 [Sporodiniella umbellata]